MAQRLLAETRIALVTGANRGIGLEIVRQLSRQRPDRGARRARSREGQGRRRDARRRGLEPPVVALDVTEGDSVRAGVAEVMDLFGRIDVLVNNAGILKEGFSPEDASVLDAPIDLVMQTFATNTVGPLRLIQAVVPGMRERGYGRVVNLSSGAGQLADMGSGFPAYRMSKAALNALTRLTAAELGPRRHQDQRHVPRLGEDRHGRPQRDAHGGEGRGDGGLAGDAARGRPHGRLLPRHEADTLVSAAAPA